MKCKTEDLKSGLKLTVVVLCVVGFAFQTVQYLLFYWTYPTVLDVQEYLPIEMDIPGISFCNSNAMNPRHLCNMGGICFYSFVFGHIKFCPTFYDLCAARSKLPKRMVIVTTHSFVKEYDFNVTIMDLIKKPVKSFLKCKIIRGNEEIECDLDDVIVGSYYSDSYIFNLCYTINSLWGKPKKKIKKMGKYDKIVLDFFVDMSSMGRADNPETIQEPIVNLPSTTPSIQLAVHSPYSMVSPYVSGLGFLGGKQYQMHLKMDEKHLLPSPYTTNCTDYMLAWHARNGFGPLNQVMVVEECKLNKTLKMKGCVPFIVDYPHNETVCRHCPECKELSEIAIECSKLLNVYNQPCDFTVYQMIVEEKNVFIEKDLVYLDMAKNETILIQKREHDCAVKNMWKQKCHETKIEILFNDFVVTNFTYKPKIESLEMFSVIGGYMGVYLGVAIVTIYDLGELLLTSACGFVKKIEMRKKQIRKNKVFATVHRGISSACGDARLRNTNLALRKVRKN